MSEPKPVPIWGVRVWWKDWKQAGAEGPSSFFQPFYSEDEVDRYVSYVVRVGHCTGYQVEEATEVRTEWVPDRLVQITDEDQSREIARLVNGEAYDE